MKALQPLTQLAGVEVVGWVTAEGDVITAEGEASDAGMHILSAAQAVASLRETLLESQPGTNEIFLRFSLRSLYVCFQDQKSLVVVCRDSISVPTLRTAVRKILQAQASANSQAVPQKKAPPRKRKSTRTGIWG